MSASTHLLAAVDLPAGKAAFGSLKSLMTFAVTDAKAADISNGAWTEKRASVDFDNPRQKQSGDRAERPGDGRRRAETSIEFCR